MLYKKECLRRVYSIAACLLHCNAQARELLAAKGWQMTRLSLVGFPRTSAKMLSSYRTR